MKNIILFSFISLTSQLFAQIQFEKGYFIDNDNQKIECLIQNSDWKNNPSEFKYKISETHSSQNANILIVKEFAVPGSFRYVRYILEVDRSSDNIDEIDMNKNPEWSTDTLFLKIIVTGTASLFSYERENFRRFFYETDNSTIKQLVYKRYIVSTGGLSTGRIGENAQFRQQLWNDVKCGVTNINSVKNLPYKQNELGKYFISYNKCKGDSLNTETYSQRKGNLSFRITAGLNYSSVSSINSFLKSTIKFDPQINFRFGVEMEYVMPYNKNKWSVLVEPSYQYFNSTTSQGYSVKMNTIELPLGIRHFFFLKNGEKLFLSVCYVPSFSMNLNSTVTLSELKTPINTIGTENISPKDNFAIGGGIDFKKFRTEVRYYTDRQLVNGYPILSVPYSRISLIFSYRLSKSAIK